MQPQVNDEYRLMKKLGEGAFGEVWKVREICSRRLLAMKVISFRKNRPKNVYAEFESSLSVPHHMNLIRYYDHEWVYNQSRSGKKKLQELRLYMEFACEGTLEDYMMKKDTSLKLKLIFMKHISSAIAFLHRNNVIHRDLKPGNILMSRNNRQGRVIAKIGDFGTAKIAADSSYEGSLYNYYMDTSTAGTSFFAAPEVIQGNVFTERADVFSMGVVFAAMLIDDPICMHGMQFMAATYGKNYIGQPRSIAQALIDGENEYTVCEHLAPHYVRSVVEQMVMEGHHDRPTADEARQHVTECLGRHIRYLMYR